MERLRNLREFNTTINRRRGLISTATIATITIVVIFLIKLEEKMNEVTTNASKYIESSQSMKTQYEIQRWEPVKEANLAEVMKNYLYAYNTGTVSDISKTLVTRGLVRNSHENNSIRNKSFQKASGLIVKELTSEDLLIDVPLTWVSLTFTAT